MSEESKIDAEVAEAVAARIERGLKETGWSLSELARRAEVSPMLLSHLSRRSSRASLATIVQLAKALNCEIDEFAPTYD